MMKVKGRNGGRKVYFDFKPHLKEIYEMAKRGCSIRMIAVHFRKDNPFLSHDIFQRLIREEKELRDAVEAGNEEGNIEITYALWDSAIMNRNMSALLFLCRTRLNMDDGARVNVNISKSDDAFEKAKLIPSKFPSDPVEASEFYQRLMLGDK